MCLVCDTAAPHHSWDSAQTQRAFLSHIMNTELLSSLPAMSPGGLRSPFSGMDQSLCGQDLNSYFCPQVTWCPVQCITCSHSTPSTMATAPPCTTSKGHSTGSPRPSTPSATSCTAHKWNGRTPTWSLLKSTSRWKGKTCLASDGCEGERRWGQHSLVVGGSVPGTGRGGDI